MATMRAPLALLFLLAAPTALAQGGEPVDDELPPSEDLADGTGEGDGTGDAGEPTLLSDEQAALEESGRDDGVRDPSDPFEAPDTAYYFVGAFYRHVFVPRFLLNLFLDDSSGINNPAFGAEVTYRKEGFDIVGSLWWASFSGDGAFRAPGDPEQDTEWIESSLSTLYVSGSFLWSTAFDDMFSLQYGVDVGLGLMLGDLKRTEAYRNTPTSAYRPCLGVGNPHAGYCDGPPAEDGERGGHYGVIARKWTSGGSVPNVFPWIALPHLALRIKPVRQLMIRVEGGFGIGFFAGLSASYGL